MEASGWSCGSWVFDSRSDRQTWHCDGAGMSIGEKEVGVSTREFDAIVLGAGPAGEVWAGRLADNGLAVALVRA